MLVRNGSTLLSSSSLKEDEDDDDDDDGNAWSVWVSANSNVHCSDSNTFKVASARSDGTPQPRIPPTDGNTRVAPVLNVERTPEPIPNG